MPLLVTISYGSEQEKKEKNIKDEKDNLRATIFILFLHFILGFFIKGCIYKVNLRKSGCVYFLYLFEFLFILYGYGFSFYYLYLYNKTVIYFLVSLSIYYLAHIIFFYSVYYCKIKYILRIYLLEFIFYQISRLCIIICFMIMIAVEIDNFEIYIYLLILTIISAYMFYINYLNTLQKEIFYRNKFQALINYNFEWMNIFCFCPYSKESNNNNEDYCYVNPRKCVENNDATCCEGCDDWMVAKFPCICEVKEENKHKNDCCCCCYLNCNCYAECCGSILECKDYYSQ